jgi:hypothetical protein
MDRSDALALSTLGPPRARRILVGMPTDMTDVAMTMGVEKALREAEGDYQAAKLELSTARRVLWAVESEVIARRVAVDRLRERLRIERAANDNERTSGDFDD